MGQNDFGALGTLEKLYRHYSARKERWPGRRNLHGFGTR